MPNRIIRDGWIESGPINSLEPQAEAFFLRLCLRADDFGRYHANPLLLKAALFPLREGVRSTDISRWLAACETAGLVRCYSDSEGKPYVAIEKFKQRTRATLSKFPDPPAAASPPNDGHMTVKCQTHDRHMRTETETETNAKSGEHKRAAVAAPASDSEWLAQLAESPAYTGINVPAEHAKMQAWCSANRKMPSRRRFVNWLNRIERPMNPSAQAGRAQGQPDIYTEPKNWRAILKQMFQLSDEAVADKQWLDLSPDVRRDVVRRGK